MVRRLARSSAVVVAMALLSGCADEPAGDCHATIQPGGDVQTELQTALIEQPEGSIVCLAAGTYSFRTEVSIDRSGVTLRGAGRDATVLDFSAQDLGGNGLQITSDGVTISSLTVRDSPGDGIRATSVRDIAFVDVAVVWSAPASVENGAYGLYPVGCDGVRIERCLVAGARDAGIYVGQSTRILVADSEAYGNVAGIEIENSTDAEVVGNRAYDNTGGILVFNLPGLPVQHGERAKVHHNIITHNNLDNFAEEGTVVAGVPPGTGILVLASDRNEIHDNVIEENRSIGVVFLSYLEFLFGPTDDPEFNAYPEGNYFHHNQMANNGLDPDALVLAAAEESPVPDILWDGCLDPASDHGSDTINCVSDNGDATYKRADLCGDFMSVSKDIAEATCAHDALPVQNP